MRLRRHLAVTKILLCCFLFVSCFAQGCQTMRKADLTGVYVESQSGVGIGFVFTGSHVNMLARTSYNSKTNELRGDEMFTNGDYEVDGNTVRLSGGTETEFMKRAFEANKMLGLPVPSYGQSAIIMTLGDNNQSLTQIESSGAATRYIRQ